MTLHWIHPPNYRWESLDMEENMDTRSRCHPPSPTLSRWILKKVSRRSVLRFYGSAALRCALPLRCSGSSSLSLSLSLSVRGAETGDAGGDVVMANSRPNPAYHASAPAFCSRWLLTGSMPPPCAAVQMCAIAYLQRCAAGVWH